RHWLFRLPIPSDPLAGLLAQFLLSPQFLQLDFKRYCVDAPERKQILSSAAIISSLLSVFVIFLVSTRGRGGALEVISKERELCKSLRRKIDQRQDTLTASLVAWPRKSPPMRPQSFAVSSTPLQTNLRLAQTGVQRCQCEIGRASIPDAPHAMLAAS